MRTTNERLLEVKETLEREQGREFSLEEAQDVLNRLNSLAEIIIKASLEQSKWKNKLKIVPQGFHLDRRGTCMICNSAKDGDSLWYDKYGVKCMVCQNAVYQKIIPGISIKNKNNWYSSIEMETYFGIKGVQIRKLIKENHLNVRTVLTEAGKVHFQVFLIKDNKSFLPPKSLLKTTAVKEIIDGQEWICWKPWYKMVDAKKHLSKYTVANFLNIED